MTNQKIQWEFTLQDKIARHISSYSSHYIQLKRTLDITYKTNIKFEKVERKCGLARELGNTKVSSLSYCFGVL